MIKIENTDRLIAAIVDALENIKGENIRILDLRDIENAVCKYFIICSGGSNTQVNALAGSVQKQVRKSLREKPFQVEGTETAEWVLLDYIDIVVHIFQKSVREYYDIESLWGDAKLTEIASNY
jgi:ribosome-associated protein